MKKTTIYIACLLVLVSTGCDKTVLEFPENGGVDPTLVNANLTLAIDPKIEPYEPTERSKASEADLHDVRWIVEVFRDEIGGEPVERRGRCRARGGGGTPTRPPPPPALPGQEEPNPVPAPITPQLPEGTTPEEGLTVPFTAGMSVLPVTVAPENAQWSVRVEADGTTDPAWLSATNVVAPSQHTVHYAYTVNETETPRTAYLVLTHADDSVEPVRVKVTQRGKTDVNSTIYEDIESHPTQIMAEVMANNDWRDFPFVQWTLKLYTDGITYDTLWGRWGGTGDRITIRMTGSPQHEDEVVLEEMTYEVVPYEEYNKMPASDRKPGWVCAAQGSGNDEYPSGTWHQVYENGSITGCANAVGGTVTVTRSGDDYTITWDFTSDAGCKVTGSYTGPIEIQRS